LAPTFCSTLEQEIVRFTVAQRCVVTSALAQSDVPAFNSGPRDCLAQDLTDRGLVACTATDAHDAVNRCPRSIRNEWSMSLLAVPVGEDT
jgi:hypothetical protein